MATLFQKPVCLVETGVETTLDKLHNVPAILKWHFKTSAFTVGSTAVHTSAFLVVAPTRLNHQLEKVRRAKDFYYSAESENRIVQEAIYIKGTGLKRITYTIAFLQHCFVIQFLHRSWYVMARQWLRNTVIRIQEEGLGKACLVAVISR